MSSIGETKIVIIWEDELRLAARAIAVLKEDEKLTRAQREVATKDAILACYAAMSHLVNNPTAPLLLGNKGIVTTTIETTVVKGEK